MSPVLFTQQINTLSHFCEGRIAINFIAGTSPSEQKQYGDYSTHDERIYKAAEFISICKNLWESELPVNFEGAYIKVSNAKLNTPYFQNLRPKIYLSGNSELSRETAYNLADGWLRYADTEVQLKELLHSRQSRKDFSVGLRLSIIARETRQEALACARALVEKPDLNWKSFVKQIVRESDSEAVKKTFAMGEDQSNEWLNEYLWTGAVPYRGGPAVAIVGNYDEVAAQIIRFKKAGISEFIFSGWTNRNELSHFGAHVWPRVRQLEGH